MLGCLLPSVVVGCTLPSFYRALFAVLPSFAVQPTAAPCRRRLGERFCDVLADGFVIGLRGASVRVVCSCSVLLDALRLPALFLQTQTQALVRLDQGFGVCSQPVSQSGSCRFSAAAGVNQCG